MSQSTIIAVANVPSKVSLKEVVKTLARTIGGQFEAVHLVLNGKGVKTVYLRLSPKLNPHAVAQKITGERVRQVCVHAYVPNELPNMMLTCKPRSIPKKLRKKLRIAPDVTPDTLILYSYENLMKELQTKFTGLFDLSHSTDHKLLIGIGKIVHERLQYICASNQDMDNCFKVTRMYRRRHPHFTDYPMILEVLRSTDVASGQTRQVISEKELTAVVMPSYVVDDMPMDKALSICNKHIDRITSKLLEHVNNLDVTPENNSDFEMARVKVRRQLKNLMPFLPSIIKRTISDHFVPPEVNSYIIRIYGEPYLPNKAGMKPFMRHHRVMSVIRSDRMYNLISYKVPKDAHRKLLAADGTIVCGAKLVIRPGNLRYYQVPTSFPHEAPDDDQQQTEKQEEAIENEVNQMDWTEEW